MNDRTLGIAAGAPPGGPPGGVAGSVVGWRALVRTLRSPLGLLQTGFHDLATTFFPSDCRACGGPLLEANLLPVCDLCLASLTAQSMTLCRVCGEALEMDVESARFAGQFAAAVPAEGVLCTACRLAPPEFEQAVAYGVFGGTLRELVHLLKYERMRPAGWALGEYLAQAALKLPRRPMTVIAVPLFPAKERQRGYNQAVLLADAMTARLKGLAPGWRLETRHGVLGRSRDTASQFALTPRSRRANLRGAFAVQDAVAIVGREVMLVDDIYTTGATARECSRVLRRAGASKVWVVTLSRAQSEFVARWDADEETAVWDAGRGVRRQGVEPAVHSGSSEQG